VGFIGRLEHQKDPRLFLDVMEHLPGYTATMVGGGSLEASLRADIHKRGLGQRVRMLGPLSHQDTLNVLSTLDALVMTSRWEGLPIVVLEAMWSGVPVVAVNVSGLNEAIMHGTSGMLVDGRSAGELAYTVVQATRDPALRMALIEQARQRVRLLFTQDKMLSELRKVYEETLQQAGGSDLATGLRCSTTTQRPSISFGSR
jgi:glycosyltransferase involved in cell wall biosynthesis